MKDLKELVADQQLEIANLKEALEGYRESNRRIELSLICIGGPLNDNKLGYTKEQRVIFHEILREVEGEDLED